MTHDTLGSLRAGRKLISVQENLTQGSGSPDDVESEMSMTLGNETVPLDLATIRLLRRVLADAERRAELRCQQALRRQNLSLDL